MMGPALAARTCAIEGTAPYPHEIDPLGPPLVNTCPEIPALSPINILFPFSVEKQMEFPSFPIARRAPAFILPKVEIFPWPAFIVPSDRM